MAKSNKDLEVSKYVLLKLSSVVWCRKLWCQLGTSSTHPNSCKYRHLAFDQVVSVDVETLASEWGKKVKQLFACWWGGENLSLQSQSQSSIIFTTNVLYLFMTLMGRFIMDNHRVSTYCRIFNSFIYKAFVNFRNSRCHLGEQAKYVCKLYMRSSIWFTSKSLLSDLMAILFWCDYRQWIPH